MAGMRWTVALATFVIAWSVCRMACANSISPYLWFWPGVVSLSLPYALPASLLAALIERPFLTAGGIERGALALSLRANLFSTLAGIVVLPVGWITLYTIGPVWCLAAFGISCGVEMAVIRRFSRSFPWGELIVGNVVSNLVLMALPVSAAMLEVAYQDQVYRWSSYETPLLACLVGLSILPFVGCFFYPLQREKGDPAVPAEAEPAASLEEKPETETEPVA